MSEAPIPLPEDPEENKRRPIILGLIGLGILLLLACIIAIVILRGANRDVPAATEEPTAEVTDEPTDAPTEPPTEEPTNEVTEPPPTDEPTEVPTETPEATEEVKCECRGPDEYCSDGKVTEDADACLEQCECVGPNLKCEDDEIRYSYRTCKADCACDGSTLYCEDGYVYQNYPTCQPDVTDEPTEPPSGLCADNGGIQWQGQVCVCPGKLVNVTICQDGAKSEEVTDQTCTPDQTCDDGGDKCKPQGNGCYSDSQCSNGNVCDMYSYKCVCP